MMPSRCLRLAPGRLPRRILSQSRHLSSTVRPQIRSPLTSNAQSSRSWSTPVAISSIAAIRHASTSPAAAPPPTESTTVTPPPSQPTFNIDTITIDENLDLSSIPERVGYLQQIGLDYGWGPTSIIQWILENLHISAGLPWWSSILITAAGLRLMLFPLFLKSSDSMARQSALASVLGPYTKQMNESRIKNDTAGMLLALKAQGEIKKRAGISLRDQFAPMIAQSVVGFCGFRLLNAMAKLPVPSLHDGGLLWLHDLTVTDGYLIAPILMGATMHVIFRLGGESGAASKMKGGMRKFMLYGMPCIVTLITSFQPGAVVLWFIGSSSIGIPQALLLQRPKVREFFKIAPMYKPKPGEEFANPFEAMLQGVGTKPASASAAKGPVYQAPNINSRPGSKTIDAQLVNKTQSANSDMVQPRGPQKPARGRKQRGGN